MFLVERITLNLTLHFVYRSSAPSTWLGVGWDLNLGARGGDYNSDSFLLKLSDSSGEIVKTPSGRFATRIR